MCYRTRFLGLLPYTMIINNASMCFCLVSVDNLQYYLDFSLYDGITLQETNGGMSKYTPKNRFSYTCLDSFPKKTLNLK